MTCEPEKPAEPTPQPAPSPPRTITTAELFQGQRELLIQHGHEIYRLRITRHDKLILNK